MSGVCDMVRLKPVCSATKTINVKLLNTASLAIAFLRANNKGADQTAHMRRLICALVIRMQQICSVYFSRQGPIMISSW